MVILWYYYGNIMVLTRQEEGRIIGFLATEHYTFIHFCRFAVCSVCFVVFFRCYL